MIKKYLVSRATFGKLVSHFFLQGLLSERHGIGRRNAVKGNPHRLS
jgi:hypothetical protein